MPGIDQMYRSPQPAAPRRPALAAELIFPAEFPDYLLFTAMHATKPSIESKVLIIEEF
jgi:hypothetical protein